MPGWEIISDGLRDTAAAKITPQACLVWIAEARLRRDGLINEAILLNRIKSPEDVLYGLLCQAGGNAFGRYNSLLRRLVKFEHALDWAHTKALGQTAVRTGAN